MPARCLVRRPSSSTRPVARRPLGRVPRPAARPFLSGQRRTFPPYMVVHAIRVSGRILRKTQATVWHGLGNRKTPGDLGSAPLLEPRHGPPRPWNLLCEYTPASPCAARPRREPRSTPATSPPRSHLASPVAPRLRLRALADRPPHREARAPPRRDVSEVIGASWPTPSEPRRPPRDTLIRKSSSPSTALRLPHACALVASDRLKDLEAKRPQSSRPSHAASVSAATSTPAPFSTSSTITSPTALPYGVQALGLQPRALSLSTPTQSPSALQRRT